MNKLFSRMTLASLALCLVFVTGAANAVTSISLTGSPTTGYEGSYKQSAAFGAFNDIFSFTIPAGASGKGAANSISLSGRPGFTFSAFNLYSDALLANLVSTTTFTTISATVKIAELSFANLSVPATYFLNVKGTNNSGTSSSYSGNVNISPVPEPETYAMLLAGLGLVGFAARRRKQNY